MNYERQNFVKMAIRAFKNGKYAPLNIEKTMNGHINQSKSL
jgi:hypothetical protein